ncbi:endospore germination permease [Dehalobacterium formicoaceticum]|uniref:Endospore germination permease n=1 Tax=Dehalobacterium formicoaceticum TaxID=51515 RepID=A0ABT1Y7E6_9FIRM|nr:endospore germination permease [Dehalobacterium formicoaceticum]MCR6546473.1 endospore germination permease [Dehalobacterium formicoaceticum]
MAFHFFKKNKDEKDQEQKQRSKRRISVEPESKAASELLSPIDPLPEEFAKATLVDVLPRDLEQITRGSKRKFTEELTYNLALLKEQLPESNLVFEQYQVGSVSKKNVVIAYLQGVANEEILREIRRRIGAIKLPAVLESSQIERNIENSNISPFPQAETTERPNVAESALIQGRFAILTEGSPTVLLAPATFFELMDVPEDAYARWPIATSFFRIARYIMFIFAAVLPGFYIALTSFNPEFIPTKLALLIAANRESTPFPIYFETFFMMGIAEAVRMMMERIPSVFGSTIALFAGIVLVIAGMDTGIIGGPVVIIVTLTIISSFGIPNNDLRMSLRIIQFFTMIATTFLGLFGFAVAFFYIAIHMVSLKSFGIPYMAPLAPMEGSAWGHTILRENTRIMPRDETYQPQHDQQQGRVQPKTRDPKAIDPKALAIVLISAILEFELFTFTKRIVQIAEQDAWISILLAIPIVSLFTYLLVKLISRFPQESFFEFSKKIWGKVLGVTIIIAYLGFWMIFVGMSFQNFGSVNQMIFLPETPMIVPLGLLAVGAISLSLYGFAPIVRFFQLIFPFMILPLLVAAALSLRSIDLQNFFPILGSGWLPVLQGTLLFIGVFQGIELILFIGPFFKDKKALMKPALISVNFLLVLILLQTIMAIGIFGVENIKESIFPGVDILSGITLPGFPVERFELFLTLPWLMAMFTTIVIYLYLITEGLLHLLKKQRYRKALTIFVTVSLLAIIYLIPGTSLAIQLRNLFHYPSYLFLYIIPVLTLLVAVIRRKGSLK